MTRSQADAIQEDAENASVPLIEAEHLAKQFPSGRGGHLDVLEDVSMSVQTGEVVAVVGESGSGKSTLLHILGTLDRPTSGIVRFRGENLFAKKDEQLAAFRNRSIGFVFQFHHLLPEFSAVENVAMPSLIRQNSFSDVKERAITLLDTLGMAERADHRPSELSGGEKQRVAMARALMNEPDLILADEPTGNLDAETAEALHSEILRLSNEMQQTFVFVTHNPDLATIAGRVLRLEKGKLHPTDLAES